MVTPLCECKHRYSTHNPKTDKCMVMYCECKGFIKKKGDKMNVNAQVVCKNAIDKWGKEKQLDMAIEELSELTKAIVKYRRHGYVPVWRIKVLEEVADVELMCEQIVMLLSKEAEFNRIFANKVENLENIIQDDDPLRGLNIKKVKK